MLKSLIDIIPTDSLMIVRVYPSYRKMPVLGSDMVTPVDRRLSFLSKKSRF
jgi:hypothetical protein